MKNEVMAQTTAPALDTLSTPDAVLRALCATACVGTGGIAAAELRHYARMDVATVISALGVLRAAGLAESVDLPLGTMWTATALGAQSVGHRRW